MNKGQNFIFAVFGILVVGIGVIVVIKNITNQRFVDDSIPIRSPSASGFSMPETLFVDAAGRIVTHKRGPMDLNEIQERTKDLLE